MYSKFFNFLIEIMANSGALTSSSFLPHPACGTDIESKPRRLCIYAWQQNILLASYAYGFIGAASAKFL